jgi:hypothetical protein
VACAVRAKISLKRGRLGRYAVPTRATLPTLDMIAMAMSIAFSITVSLGLDCIVMVCRLYSRHLMCTGSRFSTTTTCRRLFWCLSFPQASFSLAHCVRTSGRLTAPKEAFGPPVSATCKAG